MKGVAIKEHTMRKRRSTRMSVRGASSSQERGYDNRMLGYMDNTGPRTIGGLFCVIPHFSKEMGDCGSTNAAHANNSWHSHCLLFVAFALPVIRSISII
ncbi:MAG: hypothetical protein UX94_C0002G0005 [Parcubacteria group bacterium GW2011_GWA2_47_21]|nr:MAG: hypothetical protein UX94_C0002G0005 [Parcubacteria group bacterium GW2011_GWA2_47_21]